MSDKANEKGSEKGLLARTATYTSKKARRAQTKLKQRVGKGDETKDEVFDEFVLNFNKQQASATRLHNELKNYMRCITAMQVAHANFGEAVKEVYEDDWTSRTKLCDIFKENDSNWTTMRKRVTDEVLEPLTSYLKPFPDVKNKISKRARKLVDYDHSRHAVDTLRAKGAIKASETKKLNQAEEEYQKAKDIFIDLTSELYEELPALYDSRIGFYVSCFQSIFTLQEVFHREAAQLNHQLNDLMDQLIADFSTGTYSTRKPFSAGLENSTNSLEKEKDDTKLSSGSLAQFYDVAVPDDGDKKPINKNDHDNSHDFVDSPEQSSVSEASTVQSPDRSREEIEEHTPAQAPNENAEPVSKPPPPAVPSQPQRPAPQPPTRPVMSPSRPKQPELFAIKDGGADTASATEPIPKNTEVEEKQANVDVPPNNDDAPVATSETKNNAVEATAPDPPTPGAATASTGEEQGGRTEEANNEVEVKSNSDSGLAGNVVAYRNNPTAENPCNLIVPKCLYKVIATHKYTPEDEDELSFEKGEIIHVIPYEDPEEQDDGWLMGVMDSNGYVGVFPENFSKKIT